MLLDRQVAKRFLVSLLAIALLLSAFGVVLAIRGTVKFQEGTCMPSRWAQVAVRLAGEAGSILLIAAPLAAIAALLGLRRRGILVSFFVAGLSPARLRAILVALAVLTAVLHAAGAEVGEAYAFEAHPRATLWQAGEGWVWCPDSFGGTSASPVLLFDRDGLEVSRVTDARGLDREFTIPPPRRKATVPAAPSRILTAAVPLSARIAALSRLLFPSLLVLVFSYGILLQRRGGVWRLLLVLPILSLVLGIGLTWVFVQLANGGAAGYAAAAAFWFSAAVVLGLLDRAFVRRGLQLSS